MHRRALVSIALVAVVVMTAGVAALGVLAGSQRGAQGSDTGEVLFEVGEAGTVTVRSTGHDLRIVDVTANTHWEHDVKQSKGDRVQVEFTGSDVGLDFVATVENLSVTGQIRIVAAESTPGATDTESEEVPSIEASRADPVARH